MAASYREIEGPKISVIPRPETLKQPIPSDHWMKIVVRVFTFATELKQSEYIPPQPQGFVFVLNRKSDLA